MDEFLGQAARTFAVAYLGATLVVAVWEWVAPRRPAGDTLIARWVANFGITIIGLVIVRALFPLLSVSWAAYCLQHGWGLFNQLQAPMWVSFPLSLVALDLVTYSEHYLFHAIPVLWRVHRTHHSDHDFDFTTALRFHPVESIVQTSFMSAAVLILGPPLSAVLVWQLLGIAVSFVSHANIEFPPVLDRLLRTVVVTPDVHRIHHSMNVREGNSNFATTFSWCDRLFGTYLAQPAAGHPQMKFGVAGFEHRKYLRLDWLLVQPLLGPDHDSQGAAETSPTRHAEAHGSPAALRR